MRGASRQKLKIRRGEMRIKSASICNRVGLILGLILSLGIAQGISSEASAQTLTTLHSFTGSDGTLPYSGLISDASGALYGTTAYGGLYSEGTVFKLTPPANSGGAWTETILYSFGGGNDGVNPYGGLIFDESGALYGTTYFGGGSYYAGTVFKLTPPSTSGGAWTETILHTFSG